MDLKLRPATSADWPSIFGVAMQALPHAEAENREWLRFRQAIDENEQTRIHVVAEDDTGRIAGYGAVEQ